MHNDQILEVYNPPLKRFKWDYETESIIDVYILQKQIWSGATIPTYTCKDSRPGIRFTCGTDQPQIHGFKTIVECLENQLEEYNQGIMNTEKELEKINKSLDELRREKMYIQRKLNEVKNLEQ